MSVTKDIVCEECKESLWIGQTGAVRDTFYSGEPETMDALGEFLFKHENHPLRFISRV